ncbi:MAG: cysteine-rich CWC family protein [Myxococcota bacterium]
MSDGPIDPQRCPLCGDPNHCGVASGKGTCWCFARAPVSEEILSMVPGEARGVACVCARCAAKRPSKAHRTLLKILDGR